MIYHMGSYEMPSVDCNLDDLASVVDAAVQAIQPHRWGFDSIIATGMSGVLVAVPAALQLGCPVVIFRKDSDYCAQGTGSIINRMRLGNRCLWIDDFICIGSTRNRLFDQVAAAGAYVVGHYLYRDRDLNLYHL
jgi:adenine/guanine phosphoribosyltransferase-like PRPP-binding protein